MFIWVFQFNYRAQCSIYLVSNFLKDRMPPKDYLVLTISKKGPEAWYTRWRRAIRNPLRFKAPNREYLRPCFDCVDLGHVSIRVRSIVKFGGSNLHRWPVWQTALAGRFLLGLGKYKPIFETASDRLLTTRDYRRWLKS